MCDQSATRHKSRRNAAILRANPVAKSCRRDNIPRDIAWAEGSARTGAAQSTLPTPSNNKSRSHRMKALISALALLSFVGASTIPYVISPAQAQDAMTTTKKKGTTKKKAKKASAKKKTASKKKKAATPAS
jgi:hypothetical protein